jgi:ubiquitin-conjugating enzyme E2 D/E
MEGTSARDNRLRKELNLIIKDQIPGIKIEPSEIKTEDNSIVWNAWIQGAENTPYFGGTFHLLMKFPERYPFEPPKIKFNTKIFHPNISDDGKVCLNILKDNWSAGLTTGKVLLSVLVLLGSPNPSDPLVPEIAQLFKDDRKEYEKMAINYTKEHASNKFEKK